MTYVGTDRSSCRHWLIAASAFLLVGLPQAVFIWNHFYRNGAYLLDAGWLSAVSFRSGIIPDNPEAATYGPVSFYGVHISPLISLFSLLSHLVPADRITWYAITQGAIYGSLVLAPLWLLRTYRSLGQQRHPRMGLLFGFSVVFLTAFNGPVLKAWGFPHFEIAIPVFINLALVAWLQQRWRLVVAFIFLAACVREDGGFHAALAFFGVWLWWSLEGRRRLGEPLANPAQGRALAAMTLLGLAMGVLAFTIQKLFFDPQSLLRSQYLGDPAFSHLAFETIKQRFELLLEGCRFIVYPIVISSVLALIFRTWIPCIGWLAYAPWLLVNFLAVAPEKVSLSLYIGFPFVTAMFMPLVLLAGSRGGWRPLVASEPWLLSGILVSIFASTYGLYRDDPASFRHILQDSRLSRDMPDVAATHAGMSAFLHRYDGAYAVDPAAASLLLEWDPPIDAIVHKVQDVRQSTRPLLFSRRGLWSRSIVDGLLSMERDRIWTVPGTILAAWLPEGEVLPPPWVESALVPIAMSIADAGVELRGGDGAFVIRSQAREGFVLWGPYLRLPGGHYRVYWGSTEIGYPGPSGTQLGMFDVASGGRVLATAPLRVGTFRTALEFCIPNGGLDGVEFRYWHQGGRSLILTFEGLRVAPEPEDELSKAGSACAW